MADNQEFTQNDDIRLNNGEDYLLVYAKNVKKDINRTINSLGFIDNELPENIKEYDIESQIVENNEKLNAINQKIDDLKQRYNDVIDNLSYNLNFSKEASVYENSMAFGDKYFYFSAQVPESDLNVIEDLSKKYPNTKIASESKQVENNKKHKRKKDKKSSSGKENYLLVYPEKVKKDVSRSINTLGFVDKELPEDFVISKINEESKKTSDELSEINKQIDAINSQYEDVLGNLSYSLDYTKKSDQLKTKMAKGDDYFYLSGWVPESELKEFESLENEYKDTTVTTRDVETVNEQPPTRLKNNPLFRPFEYLVNM